MFTYYGGNKLKAGLFPVSMKKTSYMWPNSVHIPPVNSERVQQKIIRFIEVYVVAIVTPTILGNTEKYVIYDSDCTGKCLPSY
jgi:hypothetical protein